MDRKSFPDTEAIRRQVLLALSENHAPGFHFPGHLLALAWPRPGENDLDQAMPDSPQARNVDGSVSLAPLPWQRDGGNAPVASLKPRELEPDERAVLRACNTALRRADNNRAFIEHFWNIMPVQTDSGARCTVKLGPQHSNRVRHVQGGLLLGLAAITARAAAPKHPQLSAIASWYISPGQGKALKIRSKRIHDGRSFAAVHTEVRNADGSRVLEVVSHHAA